jgi:hypothetical protein
MATQYQSEGLSAARLLMVLSSVSPLFILWGVRGAPAIPGHYFEIGCALMAVLPSVFLWMRVRRAQRDHELHPLKIGTAEDRRDHILVYLFAMLLPFYADSFANERAVAAALVAVLLVIFLFWHLNMHYMNVLFAMLGYRVYLIHPPVDSNPLSGSETYMLITRRSTIPNGVSISAYRISNTVFFEGG